MGPSAKGTKSEESNGTKGGQRERILQKARMGARMGEDADSAPGNCRKVGGLSLKGRTSHPVYRREGKERRGILQMPKIGGALSTGEKGKKGRTSLRGCVISIGGLGIL